MSRFALTPIRTTYNGNRDTFIAKLDPTGSTILLCTYLGGSAEDILNFMGPGALRLDASGNVVVAVPHRAYYLEKCLDLLQRRHDTVFVTSSRIADWYLAADTDGPARLAAAMASRQG